ncbi:bifunctional UDP-N-acetylglucosamine diphosphorylase/glucosamine-1-phosphate N-acetyltransferase GlmU [Novimethylophilus sp.]|jgi:bifunctional UDP-N-acetylglucosamine pyrophosphorylase/glucosamine-1-phosphate N-acetyltransferase|uniref:bifunctional UDP-N-acetylglucosamine diphosphorylase/glucosamine-1-phosphate N-acetyltransferase GlmU n=1 Tax=Novimethylophilus sp. TaxID=2137426 RepID=UPI0039C94821
MSIKQLNIVILAAGKGTRMHSDLPKVLHPLAGQPLLRHVLSTARKLAPSKVCVVYGYGGEIVPNSIEPEGIAWARQEEQNGTGHAMQQALPHLQDDAVALVLLGDVPLVEVSTCQAVFDRAAQGQLALLTMEKYDPTGYGRVIRNADRTVNAIVEHKDASEEQRRVREVNTGIMAMPVALLSGWLARLTNDNRQREYYLTDIVGMAVADGIPVSSVQVRHEHEALGINSKADLAQAERIYQTRQAERLLNAGITLADPARLDVRGELHCGRDVAIDVNCVFEGKVTLEADVCVGAHCVIRNSTIAAGTRIAPFSHIDEAKIGPECRIGPYARIRPGTEIGAHAHIGNFVEIKNSVVDSASKINHLSYIGDSTIGKDVNIGAGTITCNYDGINKHRTVIEDGAFIGSDTQLVAPVTVGARATVGAGSTITKNAPADQLTLSRGRQVTISGWKRPAKTVKGK